MQRPTYREENIVAVRRQFYDRKEREGAHPEDEIISQGTRTRLATNCHHTSCRRPGSSSTEFDADVPIIPEEHQGAKSDARIAEWVSTQEIDELVAFPHSVFDAMFDRLMAQEAAVEQLRNAVIQCIREAYPVWKGPRGLVDCPYADLDLRPQPVPFQRPDGAANARSANGRARTTSDAMADLPAILLERNDSSESKHRGSHPLERKMNEPVQFSDKAESLNTVSDILHQTYLEHEADAKRDGIHECGVHKKPEKYDNGCSQGSARAWLDDSSFQDLEEPIQRGLPPAEPDSSSSLRARSIPKDRVPDQDFEIPRKQSLVSFVPSTTGVGAQPSRDTRVKPSSHPSRVVAGLRSAVGNIFTAGRQSARHMVESGRGPVTAIQEDINAYLRTPDVACEPPRPVKLVPVSLTAAPLARKVLTRRSAPSLRPRG